MIWRQIGIAHARRYHAMTFRSPHYRYFIKLYVSNGTDILTMDLWMHCGSSGIAIVGTNWLLTVYFYPILIVVKGFGKGGESNTERNNPRFLYHQRCDKHWSVNLWQTCHSHRSPRMPLRPLNRSQQRSSLPYRCQMETNQKPRQRSPFLSRCPMSTNHKPLQRSPRPDQSLTTASTTPHPYLGMVKLKDSSKSASG